VGTEIALQAPRYKTRYAGVYYRLNAAGERRYQISYKDSNGKRVFKTVEGNEKDALAARNDVTLRMRKGERVVRSKMTVQELGEEYLRTQTSHLKESTISSYGYVLDHWVFPKLGHKKIADVDVNVIADFVAEMGQELAPMTVRNCLKPLSRMFRYAARRGLMTGNPVMQLDSQERPRGLARKVQILAPTEIKQLLAVTQKGYRHRDKRGYLGQRLDGSYGLLFKMAIFTGLRKGELLALTWDDVDLLEGTVTVREGKTDAAAREVNMPAFLVQDLAAEMRTEGLVFPFQKRNVNRALDSALERAGIGHIRFHDLRHTFASALIGSGFSIDYVADQMGHASTATTHKVYSHLFDAKKRKAEAKVRMQELYEQIME
jgi:integrase